MARRFEAHPTELARLRGARLATASETQEGRAWAIDKIKELTGNERPITARFMRQDHFEFVPEFKLLFAGNHKPRLPVMDDATARRIYLIPFLYKPVAPDKTLKERLVAEYPAILRWMIAIGWNFFGAQGGHKESLGQAVLAKRGNARFPGN